MRTTMIPTTGEATTPLQEFLQAYAAKYDHTKAQQLLSLTLIIIEASQMTEVPKLAESGMMMARNAAIICETLKITQMDVQTCGRFLIKGGMV